MYLGGVWGKCVCMCTYVIIHLYIRICTHIHTYIRPLPGLDVPSGRRGSGGGGVSVYVNGDVCRA